MDDKTRKLTRTALEQYIKEHYRPEVYSDYSCYGGSEDAAMYMRVPHNAAGGLKPGKPCAPASSKSAKERRDTVLECKQTIAYDGPDAAKEKRVRRFGAGRTRTKVDISRAIPQNLDKSFGEMLVWWVSEKGMKPSEFYDRANITKQSYSNLVSHTNITPKKNTALACVIGLELKLDEAEDLLKRAGYSLSESNLTDVIVKCYIEQEVYDIFEINEVLYERDLQVLGSGIA